MQTIRHLKLLINGYMALERQPKRFERVHKANEMLHKANDRLRKAKEGVRPIHHKSNNF